MQALLECRELQKRGHHVALLCRSGSRLEEEARRVSVKTFPLLRQTWMYPVAVVHVWKILRLWEAQIVHAQISGDLSFLVPATRLTSKFVPILLTKRVGSFVNKKDLFHRWLYDHVSFVIAISEIIRKNVLDTCPIDPDRVVKLFDGVDLGRFNLHHVDRQAVRHELRLSERDLVVGMVGRFSPGKGHEEFLQAAKYIHSRFSNVRFLIVAGPSFGEEAYARNIYELAEPLTQDRILIFTGFREDIPEVLAAMDILAFPSHAEAFGDVLIEAMAMELPVVSTNCDGVLDIVVDGETGFQVPPRDGKALAEGLISFIHNVPLRKTFGKAGRKRVEGVFNLRDRMDKMEELYRRALGNPMDGSVRAQEGMGPAAHRTFSSLPSSNPTNENIHGE